MNWKVILILLLICSGLGIYLFKIDWGREPAKKTEERDHLLNCALDQIASARITLFDTTYSIRRKSYEWEFVSPYAGELADSIAVNHLLSSLIKIFALSKLPADSLDMAMVHLKNPVMEIEVQTVAGDSTSLRFGALNPTTDNIYVHRDAEKAVMLISKEIGPMLGLNSFMLRGKGLTVIQPLDITEIRYAGRDIKEFQAARSPGDGVWWMTGGKEKIRADKRKIIRIMRDLYENQVRSFESAGVEESSRTGLDNPQRRLLIKAQNGDSVFVALGNAVDQAAYLRWSYSSLYPNDLVLTDSRLLNHLDTNFELDWMVDLRMADFDETRINRIELSTPLDSIVIVADNDTLWRLVRPKEARCKLPQVERLIAHADTMAASKLLPQGPGRGFEHPQLSLILKDGDKVLFGLLFGDYGGDKQIYVRDLVRQQDFLAPAKEAEDFEYSADDLADIPLSHVVQ